MNTKITANQPSNWRLSDSENSSCFPDNSLNKGRLIFVSKSANKNAARQMKADSNKNCKMICRLLPPVIFRTPTSFALFNEPAMLILTKLTAAINKMNKAIPRKSQEKTGLLSLTIPPSLHPVPVGKGLRWISVICCKP